MKYAERINLKTDKFLGISIDLREAHIEYYAHEKAKHHLLNSLIVISGVCIFFISYIALSFDFSSVILSILISAFLCPLVIPFAWMIEWLYPKIFTRPTKGIKLKKYYDQLQMEHDEIDLTLCQEIFSHIKQLQDQTNQLHKGNSPHLVKNDIINQYEQLEIIIQKLKMIYKNIKMNSRHSIFPKIEIEFILLNCMIYRGLNLK